MNQVNNAVRRTVSTVMAATLALALAGCGGGTSSGVSGSSSSTPTTMSELIKAAQKEGKLELIGYPADWANYKASIAAFQKKYGISVHVSSPSASSADEIKSIETLKGQPSQPDVPDIGYAFTDPAIQKGLLQKYTPFAKDIPANLKDPNGYWTAAYYGVLTIGVDANKVPVPKTWKDLLNPVYKGKIYIGDPRSGQSQMSAVLSAALANGGGLNNIQPGIDFFAKLARGGYLTKAGGQSPLLTGQAAVVFDWNYNFTSTTYLKEVKTAGINLKTVVPSDGIYGNYYAQPLTANAPHPNAAKLWIEWLLSDQGANIYASAGAVPARINTMLKAGTLSKQAQAALPSATLLAKIAFPNVSQGNAASQVVVKNWANQVISAEK